MKKRIVTAVLMLCMAFGLVACGNGSTQDTQKNNTENSEQDQNQANKDTEKEEKLAYTIKVVDENNNPMAGVVVQLCKDACMPSVTDENGVAEFVVKELSDEYKASVADVPEGYVYEDGDVYFKNGVTEVTLVLKAAQ